MSTSSPAGVTRSFAALRHPGYRGYITGGFVAMLGDSIEHVISYWLIYQAFHSPLLGGFAIFSHWLPFLLFSVYSGALADRFDPRRMMQIGMLMFMCASLGWGILVLTGTLEPWHAMVLLSVHGLAGVINSPAQQMLIHDIVGPRELQSAVRTNASARTVGQLAGPAIGGALMVFLGPEWGLLANALCYLPQIIWLARAPYGHRYRAGREANSPAQASAPPRRARASGFGEMFATIREIGANRTIVSMLCLAGGYALFIGNAYQAQMPEFAHDLGHGEAGWHYSMLLGAHAAGALIAAIVLESRGLTLARPSVAIRLAMLWCFVMAGFALSESYALSVLLLFVAGLLDLTFGSMAQTLVQLEAPAHLRGRVIGLYNTFGQGLRAFSGVTIGAGGALIGVHWSLALCAMIFFTTMSVLLALVGRR
ncbi:MAG: MFS transporter [Betaproteobacteria bacterium]|nr:MFS transporter [Betaproteobacteria bacterium]